MTGEDVWMYVLDREGQNREWSDVTWILKPRFSVVGSLEQDHFQVFFTTVIFLSAMLDC